MSGYVQLYTGDGKGKTTAAVGLAIRAVAAGQRVLFCQFMKNGPTGEKEVLGAFDTVDFLQFGTGNELAAYDAEADAAAAREGLVCVRNRLGNGYDLVVLDEALIADHLGYFGDSGLAALLEQRPEGTELVLTGRNASRQLIDAADLVTEMREIKHYYRKGVMARRGIEF